MQSKLRPSPAMVVALIAFLVSLSGLSGSAFGAVAAHEGVFASSASNSVDKSVTKSCPAGKKLVGTGAAKSGSGQVSLSAIRPSADLANVLVSGREDESGFAGNWSVTAYAICATPLPGLQRIAATSPTNSSNKSVTASCPTGKKVLGAAGEITPGTGQVSMAAIRPNPTLTTVTVTGAEDGTGFGGSWSVSAYAICATPPQGLQRIASSSLTNSSSKDVTAACPGGKGVVGTGGEITGGAGQVVFDILAPSPADGTGGVYALAFEDDTGFAGNWSATSYAICANVSTRLTDVSSFDSTNPKSGLNQCPSGRNLTGFGGEVAGGAGQVMLDVVSSFTALPLTAGGAAAREDETGFGGNWLVRGYAICATPLPGHERIVGSQADEPGVSSQFAGQECAPGKKLVGIGGEISGGAGQVILAQFEPLSSAIDGAIAWGIEDPNGYAGSWTVSVIGICATPPSGLQLVSARSPYDYDAASVTATCPAGKNLLGGGAEIDSISVGLQGGVVLDDVRPDGLLRSITVTGLPGENGVVERWRVVAHAICANP